ncbi:MAG TPA: NAD(P)H-hydrate dehydratase, partial [bacterium]|nr:NAD(P)H-hydrate dehydratase [bacterium]
IGTERETAAFVNAFVSKVKAPLVIDADGLNVLDFKALTGRRSPAVLTPHPGEMGRLLDVSTREVEADRIGAATRLANESGAISVLKGRGTIVATPEGSAAINPTGNAGMATAGMGDALTGIIAAFLAAGMDAWTASCAGVWVHGAAGDMAAAEHGERALVTSDVIRKLGDAMREFE